jgi:hypothetical protein
VGSTKLEAAQLEVGCRSQTTANEFPLPKPFIVVSMVGSLLTKWTIRLSLACYVAYLAGWLWKPGPRWRATARLIWTVSCVLFDVHVACAFHFHHHWSHAAAWRHTADRTEELMGFPFGDGIFFSYVFLGLWLFDVIWLWFLGPPLSRHTRNKPIGTDLFGSPAGASPASARPVPSDSPGSLQTPWWRVVVHVFLFFIAFNGAIVFESGPTRWAGIVAVAGLAILAARRVCQRKFVAKTKCPADVSSRFPVEA